jgi:tetratricopeptide (TPR) repeat protein
MRAWMLPVLAAAVLAACWPPPSARAQAKPDLWEVSTGAAADLAGKPEAAIILGAAIDYARQGDPSGMRPVLTQYQLMHAYVAIDQFKVYETTYGNPRFKIDIANFTRDLVGYAPVLRKLANDCDGRARDQKVKRNELQQAALWRCARDFMALEVALRQKIAADAGSDLADAFAVQGLILTHDGDRAAAFASYEKALDQFEDLRNERKALASVDTVFLASAGAAAPAGETSSGAAEDMREHFLVSPSEPYLAYVMMRAVLASADEAIKGDRQADAEKDLETAARLAGYAENIHRFVLRSWPCQWNVAMINYWRGNIHAARIGFLKKFKNGPSDVIDAELRTAAEHYKKMLAIFSFSQGARASIVRDSAGPYLDMLRANGREDEASKLEALLKEPPAASTGAGGEVSAWNGPLSCSLASR